MTAPVTTPSINAPLLGDRRIDVLWSDPVRMTDGPNNYTLPTFTTHYVESDTIALSPGRPEAWVGSEWLKHHQDNMDLALPIAGEEGPYPLWEDTPMADALQQLNRAVIASGVEKGPETPWKGQTFPPPPGEMRLTIWDGYDDRNSEVGTRKHYSFPNSYESPVARRILQAARRVHNIGNPEWTDRGELARPPKRAG